MERRLKEGKQAEFLLEQHLPWHLIERIGVQSTTVYRQVDNYLDMCRRFERVTKLLEGFESPYGLELLVTVHWVMSREGATLHHSVERQVYGWSERKQQFTPRQLAIAQERLRSQGWLSPEVVSAH